MKIGIITYHKAYNYGAFLQAFSLQEKVRELFPDCEVSIIDYENSKITNSYKLIKTNSFKQFIKSILFINKNRKKKKSFNKIFSVYNLGNINDKYDVLIAGSDQIWNPKLNGDLDNYYSLLAYNDTYKISYASSIGEEKLVYEYKEKFEKMLSELNCISVREKQAKEVLEKLTNKEIKVNIDPTLLQTSDFFKKYLIPYNKKNYIFSYFVAPVEDSFKVLNYYSNLTNKKVISYSIRNKEDNILENAYSDNPFEFISKLYYSDVVITSSFHATVFSILFHKEFYCIPAPNKASRMINLLNMLNISDRLIKNYDEFKNIDLNKKINYEEVDKLLEIYRKDSTNWLYEVINNRK